MTDFENYLLSIGYKKFYYDFKTNSLIETDKHQLSSNVNIDYRYIKDDITIVFGLSEQGKPATLIHPRPLMLMHTKDGIKHHQHDDTMNAALHQFTPEEIYNAMFNKNIILTIN